jgi:hypothetical protein
VKPESKSGNKPEIDQNPLPDSEDGEGEAAEEEVTGETIMGFGKHAETTYREVMKKHYDYVQWARDQENPTRTLAEFLEWTYSDEGKRLEEEGHEGRGNEVFTYGQHKLQNFWEIAQEDPEYHKRYMRVLKIKNQEPNPILKRYCEWFDAR